MNFRGTRQYTYWYIIVFFSIFIHFCSRGLHRPVWHLTKTLNSLCIGWLFYGRNLKRRAMKSIKSYFQLGPLSEILMIANLHRTTSKTWTCAKSELRHCWIKLSSNAITTPFLWEPIPVETKASWHSADEAFTQLSWNS